MNEKQPLLFDVIKNVGQQLAANPNVYQIWLEVGQGNSPGRKQKFYLVGISEKTGVIEPVSVGPDLKEN